MTVDAETTLETKRSGICMGSTTLALGRRKIGDCGSNFFGLLHIVQEARRDDRRPLKFPETIEN
jgi:hypothetical protein